MSKANLTPEQSRIVETWGQGLAVLAGAGSGKTFTLVEKVRALLLARPEARFAAVSFTEKSASDLRAKLTRLTLEIQGRPLQGHVVTTIHGFCSAIIREYPREAGFDGDESMLSEMEGESLWRQALDGLFFEELPPEIEAAFEPLSERESRTSLYELLARVRNLEANGILERLQNSHELRILADFALERYDRLKRRRGMIDFNDLELGAAKALEKDPVADDFRKRFDLIMVDEFQDTNPVQARILTRLSKPGFSNLCVVGDPKQSIYRFRDADVSVFEDFCRRLPVRVSLTRNFRSVPGILEFSNAVCGPAFAASGMEYEGLIPGVEPHPEFPPVQTAEMRSPEDLARLIQNEVARGVPLSEMALLLRTIRGRPEKWLKALTAAGVPLAIESGGLLWNDPRTRELACFLRWWANPANEIAGLAFLRSPWVGIPDERIEEWRKTDPGMLHSFLRANHPLAHLLRPLHLAPGRLRPGELFLKILELSTLESEMGIALLALWHRAEVLSEEGHDFQKVAERLYQACDENRRERAVPPPKNSGQLRVMTVHGSKGLEFSHVILIDFPEKTLRAKGAPLLYWDRERGGYLAGRDEEGQRLKKDETENEWRRLETSKELAESKRVLYVALTRAKTRLILALPTTDDPKKRDEIAKHREKMVDALCVDFWRGWIELALQGKPKISIGSRPPSVFKESEGVEQRLKSSPTFLPKRPRHSVSEWSLLSRCPRNYEWSVIRPLVPTEEEEWKEWIEASSAPKKSKIPQSEIGTRVHAALEHEDANELLALEKILGPSVFQAEPLARWMKNSRWMKGMREGQAWKELAFEIPLIENKFHGQELGSSPVFTATLIGALDRLVRDPDGNFTILDFKVTSRAKSESELLEAYSVQLNLYAWALECLVPESLGKVSAFLIHIAGGQVTEIEVPLTASRLVAFRVQAEEILYGKAGEPQPSSLCGVCDHRERCAEGKDFFSKTS